MRPVIKKTTTHPLTLLTALGLFVSAVSAHEPAETISDPGFRPPSDRAATFVQDMDKATIAVLPTLIRRSDRTAVSFDSQMQIIAYLTETRTGTAIRNPKRIDLGPLRRPSQWAMFEYASDSIAAALGQYDTGADYTLVMEILIPDSKNVFGIELYILDRDRQHVFSFLLNSHHELFADARLRAKGSSEGGRAEMIEKATAVGMTALAAQIDLFRQGLNAKESPAT